MDKNSKKSRFLSFFDKLGKAAYFTNTDYLNFTNLSRPPLDFETKYSTRDDTDTFK